MAEDEAFYDPIEGHGGATLTRPLRFAANAPVPPLLFELVLRQSAEAIFVCDKANRLVLVNDAARRLLGGDLEGKSIADVTGKWADFYEGGRCLRAEEVPLRRALAGETQIGRELQFVRRDGVVRTVLVNAAPVYDGGEIVAAVANHSEITSYRKSEERYRALVEAIPIGVIRHRRRRHCRCQRRLPQHGAIQPPGVGGGPDSMGRSDAGGVPTP